MFSTPNSLSVLTVRHGRSTNNNLLERLYQDKSLTPSAMETKWLQQRSHDPKLTSLGEHEAIQLGTWLQSSKITHSKHLIVFTSPFKRTLDTTAGIVSSLHKADYTVVAHPDIFETGGVYSTSATGERTGPGQCLTAAEIRTQFQYDVSLLPRQGQWYTSGWEDDAAACNRAKRVAAWMKTEMKAVVDGLRKTKEKDDTRGVLVLMVMHAHFINQLTKELCTIQDDPLLFSKSSNTFAAQPMNFITPNTATNLFSLSGGKVAVHWISSTQHLGHSSQYLLSHL